MLYCAPCKVWAAATFCALSSVTSAAGAVDGVNTLLCSEWSAVWVCGVLWLAETGSWEVWPRGPCLVLSDGGKVGLRMGVGGACLDGQHSTWKQGKLFSWCMCVFFCMRLHAGVCALVLSNATFAHFTYKVKHKVNVNSLKWIPISLSLSLSLYLSICVIFSSQNTVFLHLIFPFYSVH